MSAGGYWFRDCVEYVAPARPRFREPEIQLKEIEMPMVKVIRTGFAGGHFRSRDDVFECGHSELALTQDDPQHGWMQLLQPDLAVRSAHLLGIPDQQLAAGRASLVTLRPPMMPATPPII